MAGMCSRLFVDPDIAAWTMIAFSKLSIVTMSFALSPFLARRTDCLPASYAASVSSLLVAGSSAVPGSISPSASAMICIVLAVPMNEQAPQLGQACFL